MLKIKKDVKYKGLYFGVDLKKTYEKTSVTVRDSEGLRLSYTYEFDYPVTDLKELIINCVKDFHEMMQEDENIKDEIIDWDGTIEEEAKTIECCCVKVDGQVMLKSAHCKCDEENNTISGHVDLSTASTIEFGKHEWDSVNNPRTEKEACADCPNTDDLAHVVSQVFNISINGELSDKDVASFGEKIIKMMRKNGRF